MLHRPSFWHGMGFLLRGEFTCGSIIGLHFVGFSLRGALLWEPSSPKIANGLTLYISQSPSLLMFHLMYCTVLRFWTVCAVEDYFVAQHHLETLAITRDYCKSCYAPWNQADDRPRKSGESANHLPPKFLLVRGWDWCPSTCPSLRLMSRQMSIIEIGRCRSCHLKDPRCPLSAPKLDSSSDRASGNARNLDQKYVCKRNLLKAVA